MLDGALAALYPSWPNYTSTRICYILALIILRSLFGPDDLPAAAMRQRYMYGDVTLLGVLTMPVSTIEFSSTVAATFVFANDGSLFRSSLIRSLNFCRRHGLLLRRGCVWRKSPRFSDLAFARAGKSIECYRWRSTLLLGPC